MVYGVYVVGLQNIVWERVDPGKADKEMAMRRMGEVQTYDMHLRPKGSTLHFHDVTPLDKGLYRCLASSVDRLTGEPQTVFQDTDFYPNVVWATHARWSTLGDNGDDEDDGHSCCKRVVRLTAEFALFYYIMQ